MTGNRVWRSWPWTLALAGLLGGLVLVGFVGLSLRSSAVEMLVSMVVTLGAVFVMVRVLATGVRATPSGLIIRELTRTTRLPWSRVHSVTSEPTARKGVHAPILVLIPQRAVKGARRGSAAHERLELRVLASYRAEVAQRRAAQIAAVHAEATAR